MPNPTPSAGATTTTLQVGTYTALTDAFSLVLDLNDHQTFFLHPQGLKLDQPEKIFSRGNNIRTPGETIARYQYKNRKIQASIWIGRKLSYAQLSSAWRSLIQAVERPPYVLRIALPGASAYSYADVVAVTHNIPSDPQLILNGTVTHVEVTFECKPFLRGDRLTLSNLVSNPGFEAPSGPGVTVFSDPLNNFNAYSVVAGGALTQGTTTYADVVLGDSPLRYYRLDETSGTTAVDATGSGYNGTTHGSPTQGTSGALTGDSDTAYTFASASSQYISAATTGLPTGTSGWSIEAWVKIAANPSAYATIACFGATTGGQGAWLFVNTDGHVWLSNNTTSCISSNALSLNAWHHVVGTCDGANTRVYIDGALVGGPTAVTMNISLSACNVGAFVNNTQYFMNGTLDEVCFYSTALSSTQVSNHYNAGHTAPTTAANTMVVPAGGTVTFGSSAWGAINTWQMLIRGPVSGQTQIFDLHYTDANDKLSLSITSGGLSLIQTVGGVAHTLGSQSYTSVPGVRYWLLLTQFPSVVGQSAQVLATLATGIAQTTLATVGPVATYDAVTALSGRMALEASGGSLYVSQPTVFLFGPGAWQGADTLTTNGYTPCAYAWEQNTARTLAAGPVTSNGAARIDLPGTGYYNASWLMASYFSTYVYSPVGAAGNVVGLSIWVRTTSGVTSNCTQQVVVSEYDSNGNLLRSATPGGMSRTGPTNQSSQGGWTQLTGTYTTRTNCAAVNLALAVANTTVAGADGGQAIWWDNCQLWDQTATGQTSMPYCELRFPQSPAQMLVSGVVGDVSAPAFLAAGTYQTLFAPGASVGLVLGRTAYALQGAQLVGQDSTSTRTAQLVSVAYGGYTVSTPATAGSRILEGLSVTPGQVRGLFHLLARAQSGQSTVPTLANVAVRARAYQATSQWATGTTGDEAEYYGSYLYPLTSSNWMTADAGYLPLPCFPQTSLGNPAQTYYTPAVEIDDNNASKQVINTNWLALLPVDASLVSVTLNNPSNSTNTLSTQWEWLYIDGLQVPVTGQAATNWSAETAPTPNPAHAYGGLVAQSAGPVNLFSSGDPFLTLDPKPLSVPGDTAAGVGVNQFCGLMSNASNNSQVLPLYLELQYSPLFLFPR